MSAIIEELEWVSQVMFIIRAFFPFFIFHLVGCHGKLHAIISNRCDGGVGNVAIFGEKMAFVYKKRIFIDVCDMAYVLVVSRVDRHMLMNIVLTPLRHVVLT